MGILMLINLIAVRFVRSGLGIESYGIFNAIAGVVQLLSCLSVVLSTASQRFLSISMGENDIVKQKEVFSTSIRISLYFASIVIFLFETIGLWFVITQMNYPTSSFNTVMWIYQFAIVTLINTIIQVPYLAAVIAHEQIHIFAIASLTEAFLKLAVAILLPLFTSNPLMIYAGLLLAISLITTSIYIGYCHTHYQECKSFVRTNQYIRPMLSFSTWTLFGSLAGSALIQGNMLLLNVYSGPISNAAFAISIQIYFAIFQLGNNIFVAIRSRMIQSYANGMYDYLNHLFIFSQKALLWLLVIIVIPLYYWMPEILHLWLGNVDEETILFSRWMMLSAGVISLGTPITIILQATGHVKQYHLLIEPIILLSIPFNWLALRVGYPSVYICYTILLFSIVAHFARLERLKRYYPYISYTELVKVLFLPIGYDKKEREFIKFVIHRK